MKKKIKMFLLLLIIGICVCIPIITKADTIDEDLFLERCSWYPVNNGMKIYYAYDENAFTMIGGESTPCPYCGKTSEDDTILEHTAVITYIHNKDNPGNHFIYVEFCCEETDMSGYLIQDEEECIYYDRQRCYKCSGLIENTEITADSQSTCYVALNKESSFFIELPLSLSLKQFQQNVENNSFQYRYRIACPLDMNIKRGTAIIVSVPSVINLVSETTGETVPVTILMDKEKMTENLAHVIDYCNNQNDLTYYCYINDLYQDVLDEYNSGKKTIHNIYFDENSYQQYDTLSILFIVTDINKIDTYNTNLTFTIEQSRMSA